jgi:hypothetical protein
MTDIEQFPVSKKDMERKLISQSARRLVKATGVEMKLSSSRKVIANILGYSDCHDLQQQVSNNCAPRTLVGMERGAMNLFLMENIHKVLNVPLATALELLPKLGFHFYSAISKNNSHSAEPNLGSEPAKTQIHIVEPPKAEEKVSKQPHCGHTYVAVTFKARRKITPP